MTDSVDPTSLALVRRTGVVYALLDPRPEKCGRIRYAGKTVQGLGRRLRTHIRDGIRLGRSAVHKWIRTLADLGLVPQIVPLETCPDEELYEAEGRHIAVLRTTHDDLLNLCDRGPGGWGCKATPERRARIAQAARASWANPAVREKMSMGIRKAWADPAIKERTTQAIRASLADPEKREKISKALCARWRDPMAREKMSKAIRAVRTDPATRERMSRTSRASLADPVVREKMSQAARKRWCDPDKREKMLQAIHVGKVGHAARKRMSQSARSWMVAPEERERLS